MSMIAFDRDALARWYATQHLKIDDGIERVVHLPTNAGDREIRFLEINKDMLDPDDRLQPINFGVEMGSDQQHDLWVIDVTPEQYERIRLGELALPGNWTLDGAASTYPDVWGRAG